MSKCALLLHGYLTGPFDFDPLVLSIKEYYDHVELVTYPGHEEGNVNYKGFTAKSTIELVIHTVEKMRGMYDFVDIFGYSMGGALGLYMASIYKIRKLVLIAPAIKYFNTKGIVQEYFQIQSAKKNFRKAKRKQNIDEISKTKMVLDGLMADFGVAKQHLVSHFIKTHIFRTYHQFRKLIKMCQNNVGELDCKTFIVWGEIDQLVPRESIRYIFKKCKTEKNSIEYIEYPHLTHLVLGSSTNTKILTDIRNFIEEEDANSNT